MNEIPHETIAKYLLSNYSDEPPIDPTDILEEDPVIEGLVRLVERTVDSITSADLGPEKADSTLSFSQIEDLLIDIYSGEYSKEYVAVLLSGLIYCPRVYSKAYIKFGQIYSMVYPDPLPDEIRKEIKPPTIPKSRATTVSTTISSRKTSIWSPPYFPAAAAILLCFLAYSFYDHISSPARPLSPFATQIKNGQMPIMPFMSFRGNPQGIDSVSYKWGQFEQQYRNAKGRYANGSYKAAAGFFQTAEELAESLMQDSFLDSTFISEIRVFYILAGVTQLALHVEQNLVPAETSQNLTRAEALLDKAKTLAQKGNYRNFATEDYYLGVVYYYQKQDNRALENFGLIPPQSDFFEDSQKMKRLISNKE